MNHQEYVRIVPGAETAVLFIHGIVGTPDHFDMLLPLVPAGWSVYNVLLDGHGRTVDDFGASSMKKWKAQVWDVFHQLGETHEQVVIVGHSMGTLFAIQLALERPEKVPFLFLMAVPMRVGLRWFGVVNSLKVALDRVDERKPLEAATRKACSIQTEPRLWKYIKWVPRYLELFREIRITRKLLPELTVPCHAFQSRRDELVSNWAAKVLERSGRAQVAYLDHSGHFYYDDADRTRLLTAFDERCKKLWIQSKTHS